MITLLRNSLKDGGMTTIVWVAVGSMIIGSALPLVMKKGSSEDWALRVNGLEVPYTTYAAELAMIRDYISMLRAQYGQFADYLLQSMGFSDPQQMTMQQLITQKLMVYGYKTQGVVVSQEAVGRKVADKEFVEQSCADLLPSYLYKDNNIDNNVLKVYLQQRGMTVEDLQERLQERVGTVFIQQALEQLSYVPVQSMADSVTLQGATKELALVRMPLATYKKSVSANLDDAQIRAYYDQENARSKRYYVPEKRGGSIWEFDAQGYGTDVDNATIERYYEEHKTTRYQKEPAKIEVRALAFADRATADAVRAQLAEGTAKVATVAKEYPFDDESKVNNGLLKPITRGTGDRTIERAAFILAADGDISPIIESNGRFVLLERVSKTAPVITQLDKVRAEIKEQLQQTAFKDACLRELRELIKNNETDGLAAFRKAHGGKRWKKDGFADIGAPIALSEAKTDEYKSLFTLEEGAYTAVTSGSKCYLVQLEKIEPAAIQPYETVAATVRNDLIEYRAQQALSQAALDFGHAIAVKGIREAAKEAGLTVAPATYTEAGDVAKELRTTYGLDHKVLHSLEKIGTITMSAHNGDVVIAALEGIKPAVTAPTEAAVRDLTEGTLKRDRQTIVSGYIASLYRDATIEKNDILALLDKENTI